jgi:DNA-directed RNA polymerase specialized sigma24 family protein
VAGSRTEAEEAVQEAFVRALSLSGRRAVLTDPEAWLYRVAVNQIRSRWRRARIGQRLAVQLTPGPEAERSSEASTDSRLWLLEALRCARKGQPFGRLDHHRIGPRRAPPILHNGGEPARTVST